MKNFRQITILFLFSVVWLLLSPTARAQGALYVSNLGQIPTGSAAIGSNSWVAQTIVTGKSSGGYVLNSIQLLTDVASGTPGGFVVSLYSKTGDPHSLHIPGDAPQSSLGSLGGSDPAAGGVFTYTTSGIVLSPSTFYFVVFTAATPTNEGAYTWSAANAFTQSNGFTIDDSYFSSTNGSSWTSHIRQNVFQLGIYATAVPPPNLNVVTDGPDSIKILWPNSGSYTLQQNTNLAPTNWVTSNYVITNNVITNFCTVAPTPGNLFFRLKQ
jgi:hypothetical protein